MKILGICQYYYPENFVITNILEQLVKQGHDVSVLTGKPNYGYGYIIPEYINVDYEVINGVKVHRVDIVPRTKSRMGIINNYLSFWRNSKRWVRRCKEKFDIVYSLSLSPVTILAAGNLYKKRFHVPTVVHCVDLWPESVLITHAIRKRSLVYLFLLIWSKALYKKANKILIGSPSYKQYFHDVLKIKKIPIKYVPQPSLVESTSLEPYEYDKSKFNVLYCGNLGIIQLIELIPEAMNSLKDSNIVFHVIGMGPMSDYLINKIKEYRLEDKIIYHGPKPAYIASKYFLSADALYVSLKSSGVVGKTIPNKLVMSMAFKKPIVAILDGDGKQVLEESKGAIIGKEDPYSLAKVLLDIASLDKKTLCEMGESNFRYYKENFSLENVSKQIESILID